MAKSKRTFKQITTPIGLAIYPKLTEPDTRFKTEGEFGTKLRLEPGADLDALKDSLESIYNEAYDLACKEEGKKIKKSVNHPLTEADDEEGGWVLKASLKAKVTTKSGRSWDQRPALFDSRGKPMSGETRIGSGSKLKLACEVVPYYTGALGFGISLRLRGVQVIDLVEYGGPKDAKGYGFGTEDGYEAPEEFSDFGGGDEGEGEETAASAKGSSKVAKGGNADF